MNDSSLARDLVRARLVDLSTMREKLEQISTGPEMVMQAQLEVQAWIEEQEERTYEVSETVGDRTMGKTDEEILVFDMLLGILVKKLAKQN
ncbi:hypothetical protein F441_22832 [Phytophthora nicotianae CJ01A1]|uniref:Uncharacterized protein n=3 Tax=Phytophthora nicotianae TaxID=4792 RepID=W2VQT1_PHYNI|nr:hypothetical protein L915_22046 [Phytophthora nicotianae]ETO64194.1 hypothetical protein F444_18229 [Phytophthora nicotianae P1976]ETO99748.1 hypothetical protein F441_22832 [Phytophthora nicotianae CJ01A1]